MLKEELVKRLEELVKQDDPYAVEAEIDQLARQYADAEEAEQHEAPEQHESEDENIPAPEEAVSSESERTGDEGAAPEVMPEPATPPAADPQQLQALEAQRQRSIAMDSRFKELLNIYKDKKTKADQGKRQQEEQNYEIKKGIIKEINRLIQEEDRIGVAFDKFNQLKEQWKRTGQVPSHLYKDLQSEYSHQVDLFYYTINIYKDLKELDLQKNLQVKEELVASMEELAKEQSIRKLEDHVRLYQEEWDETGPVPQDQWEEIRNRFRAAISAVYDKIHQHYEQVRAQQEENLTKKTALVQRAQHIAELDLASHKKWKEKTELIKNLQQEWKQTGFAPKEHNDRVWAEFREACDAFFKKKHEFYADLKQERENNKQKKEQLLTKAKELQNNTDWKYTTEELIKLQKQWTATGSASRKDEQRLWKEFREACDHFFTAKKEFFATKDERQEENLKQKEAILEELKALEIGDDKKATLHQIKAVLQRWSEVGHVPRKEMNRLNQSFKTALDEKFNQLKLNRTEKEAIKFDTKVERLKQQDDSGRLLKKEKHHIQKALRDLQATVQKYEANMGFFKNSNSTSPLLKEVERKIDDSKKEIEQLKKRLDIIDAQMA